MFMRRRSLALICGLLLCSAGTLISCAQAPGTPTAAAPAGGRLGVKAATPETAAPAAQQGGARAAIARAEEKYGPDDPRTAASLTDQADVYYARGDYAQAEPLYKRALAIREKTMPANDRNLASSLRALGCLERDSGRYREAELLLKRDLEIREASGANDAELARSLSNLAVLYHNSGRYGEAEALYRREVALRESLKTEDADYALAVANLGALDSDRGRYSEAEPLLLRALRIQEKEVFPDLDQVAQITHSLAFLYMVQGKFPDAEALERRALAMQERSSGAEHPDTARILIGLARARQAVGQLDQAESLYRQAIAIRIKALGPDDPRVAEGLDYLAQMLFLEEGRSAEAEPLLVRALAIQEKTASADIDHSRTLQLLGNLNARRLSWSVETGRSRDASDELKRRYDQAEQYYKEALALSEQALGPEHSQTASILNDMALLYCDEGRYHEARQLALQAEAALEKSLAPDHPQVADVLDTLAEVDERQGNHAMAERTYRRTLSATEQSLGPDHPFVARELCRLAATLEAEGRVDAARPLYERVRTIVLADRRTNEYADDAQFRDLVRRALAANARLLSVIARDRSANQDAAPAEVEAFEVSEQARGGEAQAALAKAAARVAVNDPATAELAGKVESLRARRRALAGRLINEYGTPARAGDALLSNAREARELDRELAQTDERLLKAFPKYAEMAEPAPIAPAEIQRLLRPGEALLSCFVLDDRLLEWLGRPGQPLAYRDQAVRKADLSQMVTRLRASLKANSPYDVADAYQLYRLLLEPFAEDLNTVDHLIIVPDDTLLPVPFAALISSDTGEPYARLREDYQNGLTPSGQDLDNDYPQLAWIVKQQFAISVLPSATSLRALRESGRARKAKSIELADLEPFIGIGDPLLDGEGNDRGGETALEEIRRLPRLRGAHDELIAEATALSANPSQSLFMEERATKAEVMSLNRDRLGRARVVAFATHALVGGELAGLTEPALVLTPPSQPSDQDDGLLGLQDIMELKLVNADWVILSACNTAAPGGSGEGLSGLARAFFYAGAPSLLVSQWSVDDVATQHLISEVLRSYAKSRGLARAAALQEGMRGLMRDRAGGEHAYFAHPFAWAPFFVVGEGGSPAQ